MRRNPNRYGISISRSDDWLQIDGDSARGGVWRPRCLSWKPIYSRGFLSFILTHSRDRSCLAFSLLGRHQRRAIVAPDANLPRRRNER